MAQQLRRSLQRRAKRRLGLETVPQAFTGAVSVIQRGDFIDGDRVADLRSLVVNP